MRAPPPAAPGWTVMTTIRPRARVLVVDDEEPLARLVAEYLTRAGFDVGLAPDGLTAVQLARATEPDVVVLDLGLPGLDGIEVCRQLRTFTDCYVIMLTARTDEVDKLIGLSVGADDYLTKPFSPRELVARVQVMLRRPRVPAPAGSSSTRSGARPGSGTSTSSTSTSATCAASSATTRPRPGSSARCAGSGTGWETGLEPTAGRHRPGRPAVRRAAPGRRGRRPHVVAGSAGRRSGDLPRPLAPRRRHGPGTDEPARRGGVPVGQRDLDQRGGARLARRRARRLRLRDSADRRPGGAARGRRPRRRRRPLRGPGAHPGARR